MSFQLIPVNEQLAELDFNRGQWLDILRIFEMLQSLDTDVLAALRHGNGYDLEPGHVSKMAANLKQFNDGYQQGEALQFPEIDQYTLQSFQTWLEKCQGYSVN